MKSVILYKLLQGHAAKINSLALAIYNDTKETEAALAEAQAEIARVSGELNETEENVGA